MNSLPSLFCLASSKEHPQINIYHAAMNCVDRLILHYGAPPCTFDCLRVSACLLGKEIHTVIQSQMSITVTILESPR